MPRFDDEYDDITEWDEEAEEEEDDSASDEASELDDLIAETEELVEVNEFHKALKIWRRSVDRYADDPRAYHHYALTIFRLLEAEFDENVGIDGSPEQIALFEEALTALEGAVTNDDQYYEAFNLMGAMHQLRGNLEGAIDSWEKSLAIKPNQKQVAEDLEVARDRLG